MGQSYAIILELVVTWIERLPPKIVRKEYDGTLSSLYLQRSVKSILLAQEPQVNLVLAYSHKQNRPSMTTLSRWAKKGVPLLPHQRKGGRLEEGVRTSKVKKVTSVDEQPSRYMVGYKDKDVWAKATWRRLRKRAARQGFAFDLSFLDLIPPDICPVFGTPMEIGGGRGYEDQKNSPSVDRFDNSKGYTKDNVRIISKRANCLKSDATLKEMELVAAYMRS